MGSRWHRLHENFTGKLGGGDSPVRKRHASLPAPTGLGPVVAETVPPLRPMIESLAVKRPLASFSLLLFAALVGCESRREAAAPAELSSGGESSTASASANAVNTELQGQVQIDGSSTVYPISEAIASDFTDRFPNVSVTVGVSGTGGGFKRFTKGETDVSDASRPIKAEEFAVAKENGISFVELPVAYDGLTIVLHKDNEFVDQLTVDDLKKIFLSDQAAKTWSSVRDGWPDEEIKIYAPGTDSGTFDYFKEVVAGKSGSLREDMQTSEDDNVLVTGVSGSPMAIGFFGAAYYEENKDSLRAVPIVNPDGDAVMPTPTTIEDGTYAPFSRPLFIYVNADSLKRPEVKTFVMDYLNKAPAMASKTGYTPLPESVYTQATKNARSRKVGTHYVDADGEKRGGPVTEVYQESNLNAGD